MYIAIILEWVFWDDNVTYPYQPVGKIKKANSRMSIRGVTVMLKWRHHVASQRIQDFLEVFIIFVFFMVGF